MVAVGTQLGRYEIIAPLGKGGMGEVYRAKDTRLGRDVAIKVLPEQFAQDPQRLARFEREARSIAALSHPNILAIHDYGTEQGVSFAVMELLEGETLRGRLISSPLPWRQALEIGIAIADGLAAAHAKGIVHRDLKPENLFLTLDGRVKILDFGLARVEPQPSAATETGPYLPSLTDSGTVLGTVGYMAPEQVRGLTTDGRSDIFSLGCVLYEMAAGKRPFHGETGADILVSILHEEPPDLSGAGVPVEVDGAIRRCLAKKPDKRFASARELAAALRTLLEAPAAASLVPPTQSAQGTPRSEPCETVDPLATLPVALADLQRHGKAEPTATVPSARKRRLPIFKLMSCCGCVTVLLGIAGVGGILWLAGSYVPMIGDWFKSEMARQHQWEEVARFWRPPPANAGPDILFPNQVKEYKLVQHDTQADVPDLNIAAAGRRAIYQSGGGKIELFVYRVTKLDKEAMLRRVYEVVAPDDDEAHSRTRSDKRKKPGYRTSRGSVEGLFLSYEIGSGVTPDQYGIFWWDKDWLFLSRSANVQDPGAFLKDYLATLSNASAPGDK